MRPGPLQAGLDPFRDARALELRDRAEDVHLQLAGGCRGVDALVERHERDAERLQLLEQRDQVPEVPSEAIQSPDDQHIEAATSGVDEQAIERRPTVLRPADAAVDVLHGRPTPRGDVAPDLRKLVLRLLVERADASVDGGSAWEPPGSWGSRKMAGARSTDSTRLTG